MSIRPPRSFVHAEQLAFPTLGPSVGERWRNNHTGVIVAVVALDQRRYGWVTIRVHGEPQTITTASLLRNFTQI